MSRVQELHVGNLLTVVGTVPGVSESIVLPGRDLLPTTLGIVRHQFQVRFMRMEMF